MKFVKSELKHGSSRPNCLQFQDLGALNDQKHKTTLRPKLWKSDCSSLKQEAYHKTSLCLLSEIHILSQMYGMRTKTCYALFACDWTCVTHHSDQPCCQRISRTEARGHIWQRTRNGLSGCKGRQTTASESWAQGHWCLAQQGGPSGEDYDLVVKGENEPGRNTERENVILGWCWLLARFVFFPPQLSIGIKKGLLKSFPY